MKKEMILSLIIILLLFFIVIAIIIKREKIFQNISTKSSQQYFLEPYEDNPEEQEENDGDDLYLAYRPDYIAFINEQGEEVFTLPKDKYDYIGQPYENRVLVAKVINEKPFDIDIMKGYKFVKYFLYNKKGNIIKEFDKKNYVISISATDDYILPAFYYSMAALELADGSYEYIDKNGNEIIDKSRITKHKIFNGEAWEDSYLRKTMTSPYMYETTCKKFGDRCLGYTKNNYNRNIWQVDSNKKVSNPDFVIVPQFNSSFAHSDCNLENKDYRFFNGIATVVIDDNENKKFINPKGEFINNEIYEYSEPFYRNLAPVSKIENDGTKRKVGFINKKGQWVYYWYIDIPKKEQQQNKQSEKYSGNESFKATSYYIQYVVYDNYAYISESTNKNPDLLLMGDIITGINNYNFNGLSAEKIANILDFTKKECKIDYLVKRNNKDLIVHTGNAQCISNINYNIKYDIYDNYIYVSQSNNIDSNRLLYGDIIIGADNYDFQGHSAKEIHEIWESLKNKQEVYCKVKRGNDILTIVKGL